MFTAALTAALGGASFRHRDATWIGSPIEDEVVRPLSGGDSGQIMGASTSLWRRAEPTDKGGEFVEQEGNLWFKRRRYGFGWTPVTWQGWAVVVGFVVVLVAAAFPAERAGGPAQVAYVIAAMVAIVALVAISLTKGPTPPRWRWGVSDDDPVEDL